MSNAEGISPPTYLETLVILCEDEGLELPVSLLVGGTWIVGDITTERRFFEETTASLAESIHQAAVNEDADSNAENVANDLRAGAFKHLYMAAQATIDEKLKPNFIYLKNVAYRSGTTTCNVRGTIARVSIGAVDAVIYGRIA